MSKRIITISREFGSGGRTIGKEVADRLGIPCYDSELIQKIAEESGFAENYVKEAGEYTPAASCPQRSRTARSARRMRTSYGKFSAASSASLPKRAPVSSSAAARTTFCRTRPSASRSLSTRIWRSAPSASSRSTASASSRPSSACATRTSAARPITLLHEHEVGLRAELPHHARQRRARHRQVRRHHRRLYKSRA